MWMRHIERVSYFPRKGEREREGGKKKKGTGKEKTRGV